MPKTLRPQRDAQDSRISEEAQDCQVNRWIDMLDGLVKCYALFFPYQRENKLDITKDAVTAITARGTAERHSVFRFMVFQKIKYGFDDIKPNGYFFL